jgi:ribosomal protein S12 methylthiotransferase accessory factor
MPLYTHEQYARQGFPYVPFDPAIPHPWIQGRWLGSGRPVWVPAIFVYLSFTLRSDHLICDGTSNGLAAGPDFEEAALAATMELVERDAFLAAWLTGRPGRRLLHAALAPALRRVINRIEASGCAVEIYLLPTAAAGTTAMCLSLGDGQRWPGVSLGLAADLDPSVAIRQAVLELAQTGPYLARMVQSATLPPLETPASVHTMLDHAAYYFPAERAVAFDRLRRHDQPVTHLPLTDQSSGRSLAACASVLDAAGINVALVDVTSPDVATGPFRVVRAVSPDLQPLSYGYGLERQRVARLRALGPTLETPSIHPIW